MESGVDCLLRLTAAVWSHVLQLSSYSLYLTFYFNFNNSCFMDITSPLSRFVEHPAAAEHDNRRGVVFVAPDERQCGIFSLLALKL